MYIIKNRVTNEYDTHGIYRGFHKISRKAWDKLAHAKNHVLYKLDAFRNEKEYDFVFDWYMNADFIELSENGGKCEVIPVSVYLHEYFKDSYKIKCLTFEQRERLGLGGIIK